MNEYKKKYKDFMVSEIVQRKKEQGRNYLIEKQAKEEKN